MNFRTCLILLAAAICASVLPGCAGGDNAEELRIAREQVLGRDTNRALERANAETVYNTARGFLDGGDPLRALDLYGEIRARFPFTEFATQADLESITANYRANNYEAALADADRFIKQHPRHPNIDYVYYLRGVTNYNRTENTVDSVLSTDGTKRDPTNLRQAFTDFNLLVTNYPESLYNKDAQLRMIEIRHRLAEYELNVAEYYSSRRAWVAASRRAQYVLEHYQGSDSIPRALEILEQSYRKLGVEDMAQDTHAILMTSYPGYMLNRTEFYRQRAGFEPRYELPPLDAQPKVKPSDKSSPEDTVSKR